MRSNQWPNSYRNKSSWHSVAKCQVTVAYGAVIRHKGGHIMFLEGVSYGRACGMKAAPEVLSGRSPPSGISANTLVNTAANVRSGSFRRQLRSVAVGGSMSQTVKESAAASDTGGSAVKEGQSFILGLWASMRSNLVSSWTSKIYRHSPSFQSAT